MIKLHAKSKRIESKNNSFHVFIILGAQATTATIQPVQDTTISFEIQKPSHSFIREFKMIRLLSTKEIGLLMSRYPHHHL